MHRKHLVAALAAVALAGTALGGPAGAEDPAAKPKAHTVVKDLLSPLSLDVTDNGTVFYSQNFAGSLHIKRPGKQPKTIYQAKKPGTEVGAVSVDGGSLRFATTFLPEEGDPGEPTAALMGPGLRGKIRQLADLRKYEENRNPDADVTYGIQDLPEGCEVPELQSYTGIVDSHPFGTAQVGDVTYIADAAGNDILKYGARGGLSTLAVLPPQPVVITESAAEANELPECVVGLTLITEPVPTDVEVGPNGNLYVSTLPGGPEDASLGLNAAVYRINPETGKVRKLAGGLLSATGVAVDDKGNVFVSELFRGRIAKIKAGSNEPSKFLDTLMPGDIESSGDDLYATVKVLVGPQGPNDPTPPGGEVVRIKR